MKKLSFQNYFDQNNTKNIVLTSFLSLGAIAVSYAYSPLSFLAWMMPGVLATELMTKYRIKKNFFNPIVGSLVQRNYFTYFDKKINKYLNQCENPREKRAKIILIHMYLTSNKYDSHLFLDNKSHFFKHIENNDNDLKNLGSSLSLKSFYLGQNKDITYIDFWNEDKNNYFHVWSHAYEDFKHFGLLGKNSLQPILDIFSILIELQKGQLSSEDIQSIKKLDEDYEKSSDYQKKQFNLFSIINERPHLKDNFLNLIREKFEFVCHKSSLENTRIYFNFIKKLDHFHFMDNELEQLIMIKTLEDNLDNKVVNSKVNKI